MALIDRWDRRALLLASVPPGLFLLLFVRCVLPPGLGFRATMPFAGVMILPYGPLFYLALFQAWGDMEYSKPFAAKRKGQKRNPWLDGPHGQLLVALRRSLASRWRHPLGRAPPLVAREQRQGGTRRGGAGLA